MPESQKIELETPVDDPRRWFRELTLSLTQNTGHLGFAVVSRSHKTRAQVDGNAHVARVGAVDAAAATDGVLPAPGLGGDRRRRRGLSNGVVGGVISNYHEFTKRVVATACKPEIKTRL